MGWKIWRKHGPKPLTDQLRREMLSSFRIPDSEVANLCYVEKDGTFAGRPATFVRIYDRTLLSQEESDIKKHEHMDRETKAVLFEGHIDRSGMVYLIDRRAAV